ncbi:uncharacterized protein KQ657_000003 [Scheffersomyces spartinae]|uniref:Cytochrome P450 n=1 Tax=Scheffersomyces spartinae TaxID=45513 RepID=A0A9P7VDW3_9ASCO|nr:uncharacterized protein KQ657_000003 [Scheffersomyces spartinae]KAG7195997.1 hypothetical protein KQ657_000003 [Scheffersomyces spartinae]
MSSVDYWHFIQKLLLIAVGAFIIRDIAYRIHYARMKKKLNATDPPKYRSEYLGIKLMTDAMSIRKKGWVMEFLVDLCKPYFDVKTFQINVLTYQAYLTIDPENIKAVLATQFNDFALGSRYAVFSPLLGNGIFTLDGEGWKHSRAMLRPQFAREQVAHVRSLEAHIQRLAQHIRLHSNGETFDLQELFFKFTIDTATEFLFGESCNSLWDESISNGTPVDDTEKKEFAIDFNKAQNYLADRTLLQSLYWILDGMDFRNTNKRVQKFVRKYVDKALSTSDEKLEEMSKNGYIFLYELVKKTRDPIALQDQLLNILVAGRDTTAGLLAFTFFELARNPDVWEKLKAEIEENFGLGEDAQIEEITFESLKRCEYLKFVINEALRLYPSVPFNFRTCTKDTTLPRGGGSDGQLPIFIPKGVSLFYSVYVTHRMEEYYGKDANEFRPERWADLKNLGWAYLPFNGGPRICLGQQFALTEASYVITRLAQLFPNLTSRDEGPYPCLKQNHLTMSAFEDVKVSMTE